MRVSAALRAAGFSLLAIGALALFAAPAPEVKRASVGRKPVRFWHMWTGEWKDVIEEICDRFNKSQTEYEIKPLSLPSGASTKLLLGVIGGDPPDVMAQWEAVVPTWASRGAIEPLDAIMTPADLAQLKREAFPLAFKTGAYRGRIYAITASLGDYALYVNTDAIAEIGLPPDWNPKTLEEVAEVGRRLDRRGKDGHLERIGFSPGPWYNMAPLFGGGFYDWKTDRLTIDTPQNIAALAFLRHEREIRGVGEVDRFSGSYGADFGGQWYFLQGKVALDLNGSWRVEQMRKYAPNFHYRAIPLPPPRGGVPNAGMGNGNLLIVPSGAHEKAGAVAFMKFWGGLTDPEAAGAISWKGGWLPLTRRAANSRAYQEYGRQHPQFRTFLKLLNSDALTPFPPITLQNYFTDKLGEVEDRAIRGRITPTEAVRQLAASMAQETARRRRLGDRD